MAGATTRSRGSAPGSTCRRRRPFRSGRSGWHTRPLPARRAPAMPRALLLVGLATFADSSGGAALGLVHGHERTAIGLGGDGLVRLDGVRPHAVVGSADLDDEHARVRRAGGDRPVLLKVLLGEVRLLRWVGAVVERDR